MEGPYLFCVDRYEAFVSSFQSRELNWKRVDSDPEQAVGFVEMGHELKFIPDTTCLGLAYLPISWCG